MHKQLNSRPPPCLCPFAHAHTKYYVCRTRDYVCASLSFFSFLLIVCSFLCFNFLSFLVDKNGKNNTHRMTTAVATEKNVYTNAHA